MTPYREGYSLNPKRRDAQVVTICVQVIFRQTVWDYLNSKLTSGESPFYFSSLSH